MLLLPSPLEWECFRAFLFSIPPAHLLKIISQILKCVLASRFFVWEGPRGCWLLKSGRPYVDVKPSTTTWSMGPFWVQGMGAFDRQESARTGHSLFDQIRLHQIKYATRTLEIFTMNKFSFFKISTEAKVQVYPLGKQGLKKRLTNHTKPGPSRVFNRTTSSIGRR